MVGAIGGQPWKRVKVGRPLLFENPYDLWKEAQGYFNECDENPIEVEDWVGKDAERVIRKKPIPYTIAGFCLHVGASSHWWAEFRKNKNLGPDFLGVIRAIEDIIANQQITGAVSGLFQQNIVARMNGLVEKKEIENSGSVTVENKNSIDYTKLSNEALREIAAASGADQPDSSEGGVS